MFPQYDVLVVGAGHAGCEAAASAANLGSKVLLITMNMQNMGQMSCNPAMGGIAKGQIVREIDALGGFSGIVTDETMIQFRMLNRSKGPAMWSPRAQSDRQQFSAKWRLMLESIQNLDFYQDSVIGLLKKGDTITGVKTALGHEIHSKSVVLTNGTFLNGIIHIGERQSKGGRMAEKSSSGITEQLVEWDFESSRLKTGTPPRIDGRSLDYSKMDEQKGDLEIKGFSFLNTIKPKKQLSCWITYTNPEVHQLLQSGFHESPLFQGRIQGQGPRYCPSIEDKINRFAERERHQLFVEPEGWNTIEVYVNGFSSSLSEQTQFKALKKVPGFENCKMFRPGYAIEYDYFPPTQLKLSLETKSIKNLFFAGQINGTTGYEEAACQGLMAGINAHQAVINEEPLVLKRNEAYIGVLIDDLVNKGTEEPYRMFTSRAEFRTLLRQDNADLRLTEKSFRLGLASPERLEKVINKKLEIGQLIQILQDVKLDPTDLNTYLDGLSSSSLNHKTRAAQLLVRPDVSLKGILSCSTVLKELTQSFSEEVIEQAEIEIKYAVYLEKEEEMVKKMSSLESQVIPDNFNYDKIKSLSNESRQKFNKIKPQTLGQASRISGVNPSDVQILMVYMGR
ncbi:tRNA uridine-5-carboxymethylaminomethyl(34) synthesis enzyme MnmG [Ginsengibacter hankyongi]|uniref:tRNA uridine 5-carboxymethylaminomethyl modification enzyme MnmG n=1 Tax=Ginsengibacter hankyongi TaxID=2607284 RepID=A0A5J5ILW2_9BACT|nr:tRNA uridine-5-carboxymethylaminomethyl(34) synthesis enzyme MnmG [Ginsengibacter hankyongi]KAA9041980.1 tRNA uridine-5-carboxymethylaminomethyl(34) synthesis enzyme MnmG [Ginsengibacter hankyongi]